MKTFIITVLCWCLSSAYGGVIKWSPEGEQVARDLFVQYCNGQGDQGTDQSRDLDWHCKRTLEGRALVLQHKHQIKPVESSRQQFVFIESPGDIYNHEVLVSGRIEGSQQTNIVVVPGEDDHKVVVKDNVDVNLKSEKPATFFLKNNPDSVGDFEQNQQLKEFSRFSRATQDRLTTGEFDTIVTHVEKTVSQ